MSNCKKDCNNCVFNYPNGKKKIPYCTLKRFPILNPDIGCSKFISKKIKNVDGWTSLKDIIDTVDGQERFEI